MFGLRKLGNRSHYRAILSKSSRRCCFAFFVQSVYLCLSLSLCPYLLVVLSVSLSMAFMKNKSKLDEIPFLNKALCLSQSVVVCMSVCLCVFCLWPSSRRLRTLRLAVCIVLFTLIYTARDCFSWNVSTFSHVWETKCFRINISLFARGLSFDYEESGHSFRVAANDFWLLFLNTSCSIKTQTEKCHIQTSVCVLSFTFSNCPLVVVSSCSIQSFFKIIEKPSSRLVTCFP